MPPAPPWIHQTSYNAVVLCFVSSPCDKNYTRVVYLFFLQQGDDFVIVHYVTFADIVQPEVVYRN